MRIRRRHWMVALTLAAALHLGGAVAVLWRDSPSGTLYAGVGGLEVAFGVAGAAPGGVEAEAATAEVEEEVVAEELAPASEQAPEPVMAATSEVSEQAREPEAETVVTETAAESPDVIEQERPLQVMAPPEETRAVEALEIQGGELPLLEIQASEPDETARIKPPLPDSQLVEAETPEPQMLEAVEPESLEAEAVEVESVPEAAELVDPAEPEPTPVAEAEPLEVAVEPEQVPQEQVAAKPIVTPQPPRRKPEPPKPQIAEAKPVVEPTTQADTTPAAAPAQPEAEKAVTAQVESSAGVGGKSGRQETGAVGSSGQDASAGGAPGAKADYNALLLAWLEKHKKYPRRARKRGQEGVVMLYLSIGRNGDLLDFRIKESSGYRLLDKATLEMLKRAAPLPPVPAGIQVDRLEFVLPMQYFLS